MELIKLPSAMPLSKAEIKKYKVVKKMLEAERTLKPSDLDCIAALVIQTTILEEALASIRAHGSVLVSTTAHGVVHKANPSNEIAAKANNAIKAYMVELLMTPKSKASIGSIVEEVEEDDPLTKALAARSKRGG